MACNEKKECPLEGRIDRLTQQISWLVDQEKKRAERHTFRQWYTARVHAVLVALRLKKNAAPLEQQVRTVTIRSEKPYTLDL